jgi:hypothetical protein
LLEKISADVKSFVPDLESRNGRKEIAATARKVASSKVVIDKAGKELVSEWKTQAKVVDASRRHAREFLDDLRDEIRQPLSDWEAEVQRKAVVKLRALELIEAETEAHAENELRDREQAIRVREAEMAQQEEKRQWEEAERRNAEEQAQREAQFKEQAEEKAKREAAEAIQAERDRAEQAERDQIAAEKRNEAEKLEAAERERLQAEQVEHDRIEAKEQARREKEEAIENERIRAEAIAATEKRQEAARAADRENRRKVNGKIVDAFKAEGIAEKTAQSIVRLVASGGIPHMVIRY